MAGLPHTSTSGTVGAGPTQQEAEHSCQQQLTVSTAAASLALHRNVTIGGYGQLWEVPLSTADGRSLYDASIQYPWGGEAQLV